MGGNLQNKVSCLWKEPGVTAQYKSAVSLHGHTSHSHESLYFIPTMASCFPPLRWLIARHEKRAQSSSFAVNFTKGYWTPPLAPLPAFQLERQQVEQQLNLPALISLTDHDNIEAPMLLRVVPEARQIPVSLEWSVPCYGTVFHLGVHNLPSDQASWIVRDLNAFTETPGDAQLHDLLAALHRLPEVLIVLNHPLWDLPGIGQSQHRHALNAFVTEYGSYLHAFELNGLRSWEENHETAQFAKGWNQLVIAGGDRHGCEPSAVVNLTEAETFSEFVHQVRKERRTQVLFMPQYNEPLPLRLALSVLDVLRDYPDYSAGSKRWDDRVFHPDRQGEMRRLSEMWSTPPAFIKWFVRTVHMLEAAPVRQFVKFALSRPQQEPRLLLHEYQEEAL